MSTDLRTESNERLAYIYAQAAIAGDSRRMNEVGDELRRRDEVYAALVKAATDTADNEANCYRDRTASKSALAALNGGTK